MAFRKPRVKTERPVAFFDIETYRNFFYLAFRTLDGRTVSYELSERTLNPAARECAMSRLIERTTGRKLARPNAIPFDADRVRKVLMKYTIVGFNSKNYDIFILLLALAGKNNRQLKEASDQIIKGRMKGWQSERYFDLVIPSYIDHIDLFDVNPSVSSDKSGNSTNVGASGSASLKTLAGRLHAKRMQDLPVEPDAWLTFDQMETLADYCLNSDTVATQLLYEHLKEPLRLREVMGERFEQDFRSLSDAQMGERMIKTGVERLTGNKVQKGEFKGAFKFRYQVPDFIKFETPLLQELLETIRTTDLQVTDKGTVLFPEKFREIDLTIGGSTYNLGIGGLHSTESQRAAYSDHEYVLLDWDVGSQYPSIIMKLGIYPQAVGPEFLIVYGGIRIERLDAKKAGRKDEAEGLKVGLNGPYGKLGSVYSILFAPPLMIATTLTGQLTLLMLIEQAEKRGISVISANTDGVVFKCPRHLFNGWVQKDGKDTDRPAPGPVADIIEWWENQTSFILEGAEYRAIYNANVNRYFAIKSNGRAKRKGDVANHWHPDSPDYSPSREQMKKNPVMTVVGDAVLEFLTKGTPIEDFIRGYTDVRGFVTVVNTAGGSTWRDRYLGKVVRYYWSTDGDPIIKLKGHHTTGTRPKVPKTDGCAPLMTLPDDYAVPEDVDYDHYISEAKQLLIDIGHTPEPPKAGKKCAARRIYSRALQINKLLNTVNP